MNFASAAANRTSHITACTRPIPAQGPLIAAITGLGIESGNATGRVSSRCSVSLAPSELESVLQVLHVGAGAEAAAGTGDNDRADVVARGAVVEQVEVDASAARESRR